MTSSLAQELNRDSSLQQELLTARAFCQNTNGTVIETGALHIYICCYPGKQKCLINDVQQGYSRLIQISLNKAELDDNL